MESRSTHGFQRGCLLILTLTPINLRMRKLEQSGSDATGLAIYYRRNWSLQEFRAQEICSNVIGRARSEMISLALDPDIMCRDDYRCTTGSPDQKSICDIDSCPCRR